MWYTIDPTKVNTPTIAVINTLFATCTNSGLTLAVKIAKTRMIKPIRINNSAILL